MNIEIQFGVEINLGLVVLCIKQPSSLDTE